MLALKSNWLMIVVLRRLTQRAAKFRIPITRLLTLFAQHQRSFPQCIPLKDVTIHDIELPGRKLKVDVEARGVPEKPLNSAVYAVLTKGFVAKARLGSSQDFDSAPLITPAGD